MAITSKDIDTQSFSVDRKGYSIEEVDIFLEKVSKEVGLFNERVANLEKSKDAVKDDIRNDVKKEMDALNAELTKYRYKVDQLQAELDKKVDDGRAISEALIVAQRSADKIVSDANDKAKKIIKDANDKADYIEKDADQQKKKVMSEIDDLEKKRTGVLKEYQNMLRDIIDNMQKHLSDTGARDARAHVAARQNVATQVVNPGSTAKNPPITAATSGKQPAPVTPERTKDFSGFGDADFGGDKID